MVDDVHADPERVSPEFAAAYDGIGVRAHVTVPVVNSARLVSCISAQSAAPRRWTPEEVGLLLSVVERTWLTVVVARQRAALAAGVERQRRFLRDMVSSMSEGRFCLCLSPNDLPAPLPRASDAVGMTVPTLRVLRARLNGVTEALRFPKERARDVETATGEAAMNAATHGGGGEGWVCADEGRGAVQVWMRDGGTGISDEALPRVLEKGVSTEGTLGHGFWLMLRTCDRIHLLTGPGGTTVVLEMDRAAPEPAWLRTFH